VRRLAAETGVSLDGFTLVDAGDAAGAAVAEVRAGRARLLMNGRVATPALLRAVLDADNVLRSGRTRLPGGPDGDCCRSGRRFCWPTPASVPARRSTAKPTSSTRAAALARRLGADPVRVAILAATEAVSDALPDTRDAAELTRLGQQGRFPSTASCRGRLSFDLAYAADGRRAEARRRRRRRSGRCDALFPI